MDMPFYLRDKVDSYAEQYKLKELKDAAARMSERYRKESGAGKRLVTRDMETAAYAVVRMPATFGAVSHALEQTLSSLTDKGEEIQSVLDVGAGTGTASWAVHELLGDGLSFTCIEREKAMIDYAAKLMSEETDLKETRWIQRDFALSGIKEEADLVVASYSLNELSEEGRMKVLEQLWSAAGCLLLLIEPGTPEGFRQLRLAREELIRRGACIAAPCPGNGSCQMAADDWCHFTARVSRSKLHKALKEADVPYEDEKFCYLAAVKTTAEAAEARVLRHPIKESGRIELLLCTGNGIEEKTITKKSPLFKTSRKASAGDPFHLK